MKILGYLGDESSARFSLQRAASLLDLDCTIVLSERQLTHTAEAHCKDAGSPPLLVVATDSHERLIRELFARVPQARLLLLTAKRLTELPAFISNSAQFDGFYFSPNLSCGPEFFLNVLNQQIRSQPFSLSDLLGPHTKTLKMTFADSKTTTLVEERASAFYLWCLGDETDPDLIETRDLILEALRELIVNIENHCTPQRKGKAAAPSEVEIAFDGSNIATRVKDFHGSLTRSQILTRVTEESQSSADETSGFRLLFDRSQRIIMNLSAQKSTEIIFFNRLNVRLEAADRIPLWVEIREWPHEK